MQCQHPARYVAKPNIALVAPQTAISIQVTLLPLSGAGADTTPPTHDRFRLTVKLLLQAPPEETHLLPAHWYSQLSASGVWDTCPDPIADERDIRVYFREDVDTQPDDVHALLPATQLASKVAETASVPTQFSKNNETMQMCGAGDATANSYHAHDDVHRGLQQDLHNSMEADPLCAADPHTVTTVARDHKWPAFLIGILIVLASTATLAYRLYPVNDNHTPFS